MHLQFNSSSIYFTPLAPIHIGAGEDYEPTNFVSSKQYSCLYSFDPTKVKLNEAERSALLRAARNSSYSDVYQVFEKYREVFLAKTDRVIPCVPKIIRYIDQITHQETVRTKTKSKSQLTYIARTAFNQTPDSAELIIPGTALKGVIHTALLESVNRTKKIKLRKNTRLDEELLEGTMNTSPMRLLCVSDLMPNQKVHTYIGKVSRFYKKDLKEIGLNQLMECIGLGQYRAFYGSLNVRGCEERKDFPNPQYCYTDAKEVMQDLNALYLPHFKREKELLSRNGASMATRYWWHSVEHLLDHLKDRIEKGEVALIKIGKNCRKECLTLSGAIEQQTDVPNSLFLSDEPFNQENATFPFGWALLELAPREDNLALSDWCKEVYPQTFLGQFDFNSQESQIALFRDQLRQREELEQQILREQQEKAKLEELQRQEKEKQMASRTPSMRKVFELIEKLSKCPSAGPGTALNQQTRQLLQEAVDWTKEEQRYFASQLRPLMKAKNLGDGAPGKEIKAKLREFES